MRRHSDEDAREARRNVERMAEQSEKLITGDHGSDDDANDPVVILGRRIGRGLGLVIAAGLLIYLMATYLGH